MLKISVIVFFNCVYDIIGIIQIDYHVFSVCDVFRSPLNWTKLPALPCSAEYALFKYMQLDNNLISLKLVMCHWFMGQIIK